VPDYQPPAIISSHLTDDLVSDAVSCIKYASDATLKRDVATLDGRLGGLSEPSS
jgi:hypothetical protein